MKTYHFATPTKSFGVVHTIVTSTHKEANTFLDETELKENRRTIFNYMRPTILKNTSWQLFTVKPAETGALDDLLKAKELVAIPRPDTRRALTEMRIHQDVVLSEQDTLTAGYMAKRTELTLKAGFIDPRSLAPTNPIQKAYLTNETVFLNASMDYWRYNLLANQRELTNLALCNLDLVQSDV